MDEKHVRLFQRIREKCQQRRWYGPDPENPYEMYQYVQSSKDEAASVVWCAHDEQGYVIEKNTDMNSLPIPDDFIYPPATEEQLRFTEQILGFALPSLLRDLYVHVANGGFGPAWGLNGVAGGFGNTIDQDYLNERSFYRLIDISFYERRQQPTEYLRLPRYVRPERFIQLADGGCSQYHYLDCATERVFLSHCFQDGWGFSYNAPSLYEWLDRWVAKTPC